MKVIVSNNVIYIHCTQITCQNEPTFIPEHTSKVFKTTIELHSPKKLLGCILGLCLVDLCTAGRFESTLWGITLFVICDRQQ